MLTNETDIDKLSQVFPDLENVLNFGVFAYQLKSANGYWSKGIYNILGLEEGSLEPSLANFSRYIIETDLPSFSEAQKTNLERGSNYHIEFSIVNAAGVHKRLYAQTLFIFDEMGAVSSYKGVIKDVTESYAYKNALEEKVSQLDKSNNNLQEFVYVASHDLQEPVRKITTFAERLGARFGNQLNEEGNIYLTRMLNASRNMQTLLEDLLSFSKLSFGDKTFEKVSLTQCLESVISDLEVKIEETKTTIDYQDLPSIEGYFTQLKQLFNNLLGNAIKFRKPHTPPRIVISCSRVNPYSYPQFSLLKNTHYIKIEVTDNGIGFEQEYAERIFMIFQRLNSKVEYTGSGIGLSICKKIVENHHGCIYANGSPQIGSIFTILLPYTIT